MKTDTQLQQDLIAELTWEPSVNAAPIGGAVTDAIVTLAGHRGSYAEKCGAERAAQRIAGVKALAIEIDVKLAGVSQRNDADMARSIENAGQWTSCVPKDSCNVMVENGWVTRSGEVDCKYQRQAAESGVGYRMGVAGGSDQSVVTPPVFLRAALSKIEAALKRRAATDTKKITVDVQGAGVTLTETVHSASERPSARHSARGTSGVRDVVDKMAFADGPTLSPTRFGPATVTGTP